MLAGAQPEGYATKRQEPNSSIRQASESPTKADPSPPFAKGATGFAMTMGSRGVRMAGEGRSALRRAQGKKNRPLQNQDVGQRQRRPPKTAAATKARLTGGRLVLGAADQKQRGRLPSKLRVNRRRPLQKRYQYDERFHAGRRRRRSARASLRWRSSKE